MPHPQMRCLNLTSRSLSLSPHSGRAAVKRNAERTSAEIAHALLASCVSQTMMPWQLSSPWLATGYEAQASCRGSADRMPDVVPQIVNPWSLGSQGGALEQVDKSCTAFHLCAHADPPVKGLCAHSLVPCCCGPQQPGQACMRP